MGYESKKIRKTEAEWRESLNETQYRVTRKGATEPAFTGAYWDCKDPGTYRCVCCGEELFASGDKYESGTGWPSFVRPIARDRVETQSDHSLGMTRTEVLCGRCDAHLGHVFPDGPEPTGERFCINSAALQLERADED